jgi:hypothetical protein
MLGWHRHYHRHEGHGRMRATYSRIVADDAGVSHLEDLDVELMPGLSVPPASPLNVAEFLKAEQCSWFCTAADWNGGLPMVEADAAAIRLSLGRSYILEVWHRNRVVT